MSYPPQTPYDLVEQQLLAEAGQGDAPPLLAPILLRLAQMGRRELTQLTSELGDQFDGAILSDLERLIGLPSQDAPLWQDFFRRVIVFLPLPQANASLSDQLTKVASALQAPSGVGGTNPPAPFEVLWIGPAVTLPAPGKRHDPTTIQRASTTRSQMRGKPILGIIDDGIGYLNEAFRISATRSRFGALWQMHRPVWGDDGNLDLGLDPLRGEQIDQLLVDIRDGRMTEAEIYQSDNARLYAQDSYHGTSRTVTHGTHMLDLMCRQLDADPSPDLRDILAVQLPPFSIRDTTGHYLGFFAFLGLRQILWQMLTDPDLKAMNGAGFRPLVLSVSLGMVAGPKDGSGHFQREFAAEIDAFKRATGLDVQSFFAFGNAFNDRQVAAFRLEATERKALSWTLQPDDMTASFCELRAKSGEAFAVSVTDPSGAQSQPSVAPAPGEMVELVSQNGISLGWAIGNISCRYDNTGALSCEPDGIVVALRPTHDRLDSRAGRSGRWMLHVTSQTTSRLTMTAQIQSGGTPPGYIRHGRQSFFENPQTDASITIDGRGSFSAFAPVGSAMHQTVGAARAGARDPMPYTSEGGLFGQVDGPALAAVVEDHFLAGGVLATGTLSGSTARLGGTSAATAIAAGQTAADNLHISREPNTAPTRLGQRVLLSRGALE